MAPQQSGVFAGFDLQNEVSLIQLVEALQYFLGGGRNPGHPAARGLGNQRLQSIRAIVGRRRVNADFRTAVNGLLEHEGDLVEAAAVLAAYAVVEVGDASTTPPPVDESPDRPQPEFRWSNPSVEVPEIATSLQMKSTARQDNTPNATTHSSHRPSLQRGYECYDNGNINRTVAKLGQPDPTKFAIFLHSRKADVNNPGQYIEGKGATYTYPQQKDFNWKEIKDIKRLHQWREQIFRRRIGGLRATRPFWLESEKDLLLSMIKEHLERHRRPKFNKLTNRYNSFLQGKTQRKGEKQVFAGKKKDGGIMEADRTAPWRTRSALEGQTSKWLEHTELLLKKKDEEDDGASEGSNARASSDDEVEIENPTPAPTVFKPRKQKPWRRPGTKPQTPKFKSQPSLAPTKTQVAGKKRKHEENEEVVEDPDSDSDEESSDLSDGDDLSDPFNSE